MSLRMLAPLPSVALVWAVAAMAFGDATAAPSAGATPPAQSEQAAALFAAGQAALAKGDFPAADKALAGAAHAEPANAPYQAEAALLKRMLAVRDQLDRVENPQEWLRTAFLLRLYYMDHRVFGEAVALSKKMHENVKLASSAALVGESLLALDKNAEALAFLAPYAGPDGSTHTHVLLAIAQAHAGQRELPKLVAADVRLTPQTASLVARDLARLRALVGDRAGAIAALTQHFKTTSPSRLELARANARHCSDFRSIADSDAFAAALKTPSEISESACGVGGTCGTGPYDEPATDESGGARDPNAAPAAPSQPH